MTQSDTMFAGSIPQIYDGLMVPMIFEAYAASMADLVAGLSPVSVIETAAGSGAVHASARTPTQRRSALRSDRLEPAHARVCRRPPALPIGVSNGGRRTHWTCRSKSRHSMSFAASSA